MEGTSPASAKPAEAEPPEAENTGAGRDAVEDLVEPGVPRRSLGRRAVSPGVLSVALALACVGFVAAGIAVALGGDFAASTLLAQLAIGCSIAAIVSGLVSIVLGRGRGRVWGIAGCALGLLANPLVAVAVLRTFDGI